MCLVDMLPRRLVRLERAASFRMKGLRVILDNVADPGNRAAVMRTAEAFGVMHVHMINAPITYDHLNQPIYKKRQFARAVTTGSEKWLQLHSHPTAHDCMQALRLQDTSIRVICAKPEAPARDTIRGQPTHLHDINFGESVALVFGNEQNGVSQEMSAMADGDFTIPMFGLTESLNISVAAAVSIHWGRFARERALGRKTDLEEHEIMSLLDSYKSLRSKYQAKMKMMRRDMTAKRQKEIAGADADEDCGDDRFDAVDDVGDDDLVTEANRRDSSGI